MVGDPGDAHRGQSHLVIAFEQGPDMRRTSSRSEVNGRSRSFAGTSRNSEILVLSTAYWHTLAATGRMPTRQEDEHDRERS